MRKNLLLTLWLLAPIGVVVGLVWFIWFSLRAGPEMTVPGRGPGAGDTGGANALGELLAGNDPLEVDAQNRALREGRLIDPSAWPGGLVLVVEGAGLAEERAPYVGYRASELGFRVAAMEPAPNGAGPAMGYRHEIAPGGIQPGSRVFVGINGLDMDAGPGGAAVDGLGNVVPGEALAPVRAADLVPGEPIVVKLRAGPE